MGWVAVLMAVMLRSCFLFGRRWHQRELAGASGEPSVCGMVDWPAVGNSGSIEKLCRQSDTDLQLGREVDRVDQRNDAGGDRFGVADGINPFAGFRLQPDPIDGNVNDFRDPLAHPFGVRGKAWLLGQDHTIEVADFHAVMANPSDGFEQKIGAVTFVIFIGCIREQTSDVGFGDRPEQRVGDRVQQNVCVAVTDRVDFGRDVNPADPQRASVAQAVRVKTETYAKWKVHDGNACEYRKGE
jgi:hypothetical protein